MEKWNCKMCGVESQGFGNNPQPLLESVDDRVCYECNARFVVPARSLEAMSIRRANGGWSN